MIRETLKAVKAATFCVELPNSSQHGMSTPAGTGFFISPEGWFITAAHVVIQNGNVRNDIDRAQLMKEPNNTGDARMCQFLSLEHILPDFDLALLRVDFDKNSTKEGFIGKSGFPHIKVSTRQLDMGEPVYSFGYPLSSGQAQKHDQITIGHTQLSPRLTSAVVASDLYETQMIMTSSDPKCYVLDKALNYGNSGGPIIASETGNVHALCSRFQPVFVPQHHLKDGNGGIPQIMVPSLYGVVSNLNNTPIINLFRRLGIPVTDE